MRFPKRRDEELDEEIRAHLEMATRDRMERGQSAEQARNAALREFGNVSLIKEVTRDMWSWTRFEQFAQDLRFGARMLAKRPGFALVAILTLALGIGANTAIFTVIYGVLLRPLPFNDPDRVVWMWGAVRDRGNRASVSPLDFLDYRARSQSFEEFAASISIPISFTLTGSGEPERLSGAAVTTNYFAALGAKPMLGRSFVSDEEQAGRDRAVILSHSLWQRRFGADPQIVDRTITLDGQSFTVVGVMPPAIRFPFDADLWRPISFDANPEMRQRKAHFLRPIGRLRADVTLDRAQAEIDTIARQLEEQYPDTNTKWTMLLVPLQERIVGDIRPTLWILLGAVAFVLLIACSNVANLLLARSAARHREMAIRLALGASRWRIVRQMLTESLLLSLAGGVLGVLLALWGVGVLVSFSDASIPRAAEIGVNAPVLAFTLIISLITGTLFGLVPALGASRPDLHDALKEGTRSVGSARNRLRSFLVVVECTLAVVLLIGAGLLIKSFVRLQQVSPGFEAERVLTMRLDLPPTRYATPQQAASFFQRLQQSVAALPGVEAVGMISELPLSGQPNDGPFAIEGRPPDAPDQRPLADFRRVNHEYFRALGIPLLRGRPFTEQESQQSANVVIVSERLAEQYFPDEEAVGKHLRLDFMSKAPYEIIGVVGDVRHRALAFDVYPAMYLPTLSLPRTNLVVRAAGDPASLAIAVRKEVTAIDPQQPVAAVKTMGQWVSESVAQPRFRTLLLGIFAAVALLLSVIGIYGVMSYVVAQRTREVGIRMALGARPRDVLKLVVGQGMRLALAGVAIGVVAAYALTRLLETLLYEVSATDPATFAAIALLLTGVALLACYMPARRAAKVDPTVALRYE
ncbi:MAG TPA: ABC transporter permease [Blastocatellia bacterium]|nr:ABC transporter permease [Blastocatellia bacterium]